MLKCKLIKKMACSFIMKYFNAKHRLCQTVDIQKKNQFSIQIWKPFQKFNPEKQMILFLFSLLLFILFLFAYIGESRQKCNIFLKQLFFNSCDIVVFKP